MKTIIHRTFQFAAVAFVGLLAACATAPSTTKDQTDLHTDAGTALAKAQQSDPSLEKLIADSAGYAIFPSVGKGAVGIGGAYGKGEVYENGDMIGYCDMTQVSIGVSLGGQTYTEILIFQTPAALDRFKKGNFHFAAQANAVAVKSGAAANAKFTDEVAVFTMNGTGLMFEASLGGQEFGYKNK